jgi:hypothetical protein
VTMNKKAPPDDPLAGIRTKIGDLQEGINAINERLDKPRVVARVQAWIWKERSWCIAVILGVLGAIGAAIWYVGGLILDKHVQSAVTSANGPLQADIRRIDGDIQEVRATVKVLQAQIAADKFSVVPEADLKSHRDELNSVRGKLATVPNPNSTPGYWPAAFQIISLASKAVSTISENIDKPESIFDDVRSIPGGIGPVRDKRVVLKNQIQGLTFINSIIRFDPSVRLANDTFINCVFILPTQESPPKVFQEIGKTLLASDLTNVTISAS